MNSENAELMKLFNETIVHWKRMIMWAERQPKDEVPRSHRMFEKIKMDWYGESCSFCRKFAKYIKCKGCPLTGEGCCDGLWRRVCGVSTWEKWVERASDVLIYIKEKRDENQDR